MVKNVSKKKLQYPTKKTLNLATKETTINSPSRVVPIFLILLVAIGAFTKFAVMDRLSEVTAARASLVVLETRLAEVEGANAANAAIEDEYNRYSYRGFTEEETSEVDRMEILDLLEGQLMTPAQVSNVSVMSNTMQINLSGVTLSQLSNMIGDLKACNIVYDVWVYTAGTQSQQRIGDKEVVATMTITLTQTEKGGDVQ